MTEPASYQQKIILAKEVVASAEGLTIRVADETYFQLWGECSEPLANASDLERRAMRMSPSGYGIHWPLLDEDLAVGPLIEGRTPASS